MFFDSSFRSSGFCRPSFISALYLLGWVVVFLQFGCSHSEKKSTFSSNQSQPTILQEIPQTILPGETFFKSVKQLTSGGTNAEAYWSFDGEWLSFQHQGPGLLNENPACDQIYKFRKDGTDAMRISNGQGRTTCSFFLPNTDRILFSSTMATQPECLPTLATPAAPDRSRGYVWPIDPTYQIFGAKTDGTDPIPLEPDAPRAYHAEATVCHDGSVVFTSDRDGNLELYRATLQHFGTFTDVKRITYSKGYNGGAFFSPDCKKIVWSASRPRPGQEQEEYEELLAEHLVKPKELEIWMADSDGTHAHQVTRLNAASFAPTFTPDGKKILFSSNFKNLQGHSFEIYMIHTNGTGLELVTHAQGFDSFPMFSPNGKLLAFSSKRNANKKNAKSRHETNIYVAEWKELPPRPLSLDDSDPADRYLALIQKLSAPELQGRGLGSPGLAQAEELIAERFSTLGLQSFQSVFQKKSATLPPESFKIPVQIPTQVYAQIPVSQNQMVTTNNVVGVFGQGCQSPSIRPIIIGAHLDHLGMGGDESLEPLKSGIHPGADDNASGVAALVEIARIIHENPSSKNSCFIFAAFTGEEVGITGSNSFVQLLKKLKIHPKAMINLDMVGRMQNNTLLAFGSDSAKEWKDLLNKECTFRRLECKGGGDGYGPSDHMGFYVAKIPVLHFFTGPHLDYHRTSDTADKINATGGVQTAELVAAIALRISKPGQTLQYQKGSSLPSMGPVTGKDGHSNSSYLGTIPDYSTLMSPHGPAEGGEPDGGVKLAGVRPGSPADQAGIREGDILKAIQNFRIHTLQDFTQALREFKPGQNVTVEIVRNSKPLQLKAILGKR
jgi:Tol biopolymer transport system component